MGSATIATPGGIPFLYSAVSVNGMQDARIQCLSITTNHGLGGSSAEFAVPQWRWDEIRDDIKDAEIAVALGSAIAPSNGLFDFIGYVQVESAAATPGQSDVVFHAVSVTAMLKHVWVGQKTASGKVQPIKEYKQYNPRTGTFSSWTPEKVLLDLFSATNLPNGWYTNVRLGITSPLSDNWDANASPEYAFRFMTYTQALEYLLSLVGDCSFRERYDPSGITYLDFFKIKNPSAPITYLRICPLGADIITSGANVQSINQTDSTGDACTRYIGVGKRKLIMLTASTEHLTAPLEKKWDAGETVRWISPDNPEVQLTAEGVVLKDPEIAKDSSKLSGLELETGADQVAWETVFRRYQLPQALMQFTAAKNNAKRRSDGSEYSIQVWRKIKTLKVPDTPGDYDFVADQSANELLNGVDLHLEDGYFILSEPAVHPYRGGVDQITAQPYQDYEESEVCITLTLEMDEWLTYDTRADIGIAGDLAFPWAAEGHTIIVPKSELEYSQMTNSGVAITHGGTSHTFDCTYRNEDTEEWATVTTRQVIRDDEKRLKRLCLNMLQENNGRARTYGAIVPWFTRNYVLGTLAAITGQANYKYDLYMVTSVTFDVVGQNVIITLDNSKPPSRQDA